MKFPNCWLNKNFLSHILLPFSWVYLVLITLRKKAYQFGLLESWQASVPVIIVGNIIAGGSGKTPMVIHLSNLLQKQGFKVGIISKGYRSEYTRYEKRPLRVHPNHTANYVGDEPLMLTIEQKAPVVICFDRKQGIKYLCEELHVNCIIADDGLQDYSINRQIEIELIDGLRGYANNRIFPAGALRESIKRSAKVDYKVITGSNQKAINHDSQMLLCGEIAINLFTAEKKALIEFSGTSALAIAGIGNPERFFNELRKSIVDLETLSFSDHHQFNSSDLPAQQDVIMTSKDAVKCRDIVSENYWYVPVYSVLSDNFDDKFIKHFQSITASF